MARLKLTVYRSSNNPVIFERFQEGYQAKLAVYFGEEVALPRVMPDFDQILLCIEDEHARIVGGVKISIFSPDHGLPLVKVSQGFDPEVKQKIPVSSAELHGIWNTAELAGWGIDSAELIKMGVAVAFALNIHQLHVLVASVTGYSRFGFVVNQSLGDRGMFPSINVRGLTLMAMVLDIRNAKHDSTPNLQEAYKISKKEITVAKISGPKGEVEILYDISLPSQKSILKPVSLIDIALYEAILNNPALLKSIHWRNFEKLLADILETFEYEIDLMQGTKDGGIDIIAFTRNGDFGGHKYLLQAKRWNNKIDVDVVKNVMFNHDFYKATKSCLATTATFTRGAWELAELYKWQLELKDYESIRQWIDKAYKKKKGS